MNAHIEDVYVELPLKVFMLKYPQYAHLICIEGFDINDPNYIVRFQIENGKVALEVGYPDDPCWHIGKSPESSPYVLEKSKTVIKKDDNDNDYTKRVDKYV